MRGSVVAGARWARIGLSYAGVGLAAVVGGCGTYVPTHQETGDDVKGAMLENAIVDSVHCELRNSVIKIFVGNRTAAAFFQSWAVQVSLQLTAEEKTTIAPNAFFTFLPSFFQLGLGASGQTDATRLDKFNYYYTIQDLLKYGPCDADFPVQLDQSPGAGSLLIRSDLKTFEWLGSVLLNKTSTNVDGQPDQFSKTQNGFSHEVKFVLDTSLTMTPGAKFPTITLMPSGQLVVADRIRTHDLTLTFGPASDDDKSKKQLAPTAQAIFQSNQISSGITGALRSRGLR